MSYAAHFAEHLRLALLRVLHEAPGYAANGSILQDAAEMLGLRASRDLVEAQLAWLDEQGLVSLERLPAGVSVATLTARGADVATGRAIVPGVVRPGPRG